jgi:hypothetical protein
MNGAEFDAHHWHDDEIHAFELRVGDPDLDDWTSDLVLDIDHIVEWVRTEDGMRFRVAPATLVFHGATDLRIEIDAARGGHSTSLMLPSISRVERERMVDQKVFLDRPYYRWRIVLNGTPDGEISFGAVGFDETLRGEPLLVEQVRLHRSRRVAGPSW